MGARAAVSPQVGQAVLACPRFYSSSEPKFSAGGQAAPPAPPAKLSPSKGMAQPLFPAKQKMRGDIRRSDRLDAVRCRIAKLPDCKPVSVPLRAAVIPLGRPLLTGSSDLPGSLAGRAAPPPLFGLAPRGVFPAGGITPAAVRSYRTISPLPHTVRHGAVYFLWHFPSNLAARPAVSRHVALWRPDFPPPFPEATAHPAASQAPLSHFPRDVCATIPGTRD